MTQHDSNSCQPPPPPPWPQAPVVPAPYLPPPTPGQPLGYATPGTVVYRSPDLRATLATVGLVACAVTQFGLAVFSVLYAVGVVSFDEAEFETGIPMAAIAAFGLVALYTIAFVYTIITYLMWVNRVHWNLRAITPGPFEYSPGWAVGYYFIPILNFFRPYQAMREVYVASSGIDRGGGGRPWGELSSPAIIGWWWGAWVISRVLDTCSNRLQRLDETEQLNIVTGIIDVVTGVLAIAAAVLLIRLIRCITRMQDERASGWGSYALHPAPYAPPQYPYASPSEQ